MKPGPVLQNYKRIKLIRKSINSKLWCAPMRLSPENCSPSSNKDWRIVSCSSAFIVFINSWKMYIRPFSYFLFFVLCSLFSVLCSLFSVLCFLLTVFCSLFSVLCFLFSVLCFLFSVLCSLFSKNYFFTFSLCWDLHSFPSSTSI